MVGRGCDDDHGAQVSDAELHAHAQQHIGERPAWTRHFHIIEAIPVTSVGKIFEPELRCDAAARMFRQLFNDQFQLADARVEVRAGEPRGMRVSVSLPKASSPVVPAVKKTLDAYLSQTQVPVV